jgi:hypothetical protein
MSRGFTLHPRGVIRNGLWNSSIPFNTTPTPIVTNLDTTGTIFQNNRFRNSLDRDSMSNNSRTLTLNSPCVFSWTNLNRNVTNLTIYTGFLSNNTWGSPVRNIRVTINGNVILNTTNNNSPRIIIPVNTNVSTLRIEFLDTGSNVYNRIREIVF